MDSQFTPSSASTQSLINIDHPQRNQHLRWRRRLERKTIARKKKSGCESDSAIP